MVEWGNLEVFQLHWGEGDVLVEVVRTTLAEHCAGVRTNLDYLQKLMYKFIVET